MAIYKWPSFHALLMESENSHNSIWRTRFLMKVIAILATDIILFIVVFLFVCFFSLVPPELYADSSKELSSDFVHCKLAVIPERISELITAPGDIGFSFLDTTKKLAQFVLPSTQHEVSVSILYYMYSIHLRSNHRINGSFSRERYN